MNRILLVDDADSNRWTLAALLEDEGFDVQQADSYQTASACIEGTEAPYDAVLLDLHLGDRSGLELVPILRRRMPGAAILLITGTGNAQDHAAMVDGALAKTVDFQTLLGQLQSLLLHR